MIFSSRWLRTGSPGNSGFTSLISQLSLVSSGSSVRQMKGMEESAAIGCSFSLSYRPIMAV